VGKSPRDSKGNKGCDVHQNKYQEEFVKKRSQFTLQKEHRRNTNDDGKWSFPSPSLKFRRERKGLKRLCKRSSFDGGGNEGLTAWGKKIALSYTSKEGGRSKKARDSLIL